MHSAPLRTFKPHGLTPVLARLQNAFLPLVHASFYCTIPVIYIDALLNVSVEAQSLICMF